MSKPRVAILGLGIMGSGMASRAIGAGLPTTVYNRSPDRAKALAASGASVASSPREAAAAADVVICMVADDVASRAMWTGENGALAGAKRETILIDSSTLTVQWVRELGRLAADRGFEFLDAPVTGTKPHAAAGELTFFVGGSADTLAKVRPVLEVMSRTIIHLGPTGSGAIVKLINNFMAGVQLVTVAEAFSMMERFGLDIDRTIHALSNGAAGSPMVKTILARVASGASDTNFLLKLMAKDMTYAIQEGAALGVDLTTATSALAQLRRGIDAGFGDKDLSSIVEYVRKLR